MSEKRRIISSLEFESKPPDLTQTPSELHYLCFSFSSFYSSFSITSSKCCLLHNEGCDNSFSFNQGRNEINWRSLASPHFLFLHWCKTNMIKLWPCSPSVIREREWSGGDYMYYTLAETVSPPPPQIRFQLFCNRWPRFPPIASLICLRVSASAELQTVGAARHDIECSVVAHLSNLIKTTAVKDLADFTYLY